MQHHRIPFVHRLAVGVVAAAALAGCSSAGTITDGNGTTGRDTKGGNTTGGNGTAGGILPQPSATKPGTPAGNSGPKWVISMPDSIDGDPRLQDDNATVQQIEASAKTDMDALGALGVTGQRVQAVYDDSEYYLVVWGVNGEGFNPANLQKIYPQFPTDGLPTGSTVQYPKVDPGPHGGNDQCTEISMVQSSDTAMGPVTIVGDSTTCMWMTASTIGRIAYMAKDTSDLSTNLQITPAVVGPAMLKVRDAVEHQQG